MIFASLLINAHDGRAVPKFKVPVANIHASLPNDKVVHMKFEGEFVDIMCKVNPEYEKFVIYERGKNMLYVLIFTAIYGIIESTLI